MFRRNPNRHRILKRKLTYAHLVKFKAIQAEAAPDYYDPVQIEKELLAVSESG